MLNYDLLKQLYDASGISNSDFNLAVFGPGAHRSINYFQKHSSISTDLLIRLCNLFHISSDALLNLPNYLAGKDNVVIGNNNNIGNNIGTDSIKYLQLIKSTIETQEKTIQSLQIQLEKKDERILNLMKTQDAIVQIAKEGGSK